MRRLFFSLPLGLFCILFSFSCTKPTDTTPAKNDSLPQRTDSSALTRKNQWELTVDGKTYKGTIDTGFSQLYFNVALVDTLVVATGTSSDKKAHVHFKVALNQKGFPSSGADASNSFLIFDTSTYFRYTSFVAGVPVINYTVDTVQNNTVVVRFTGSVTVLGSPPRPVSGKFSCTLNTGNNEPNKYYCLLDSAKRAGYLTNATFSGNALVLNGLDYLDQPSKYFRLVVRTGGTIRPGTYKSSEGDVSLRVYTGGYGGIYFYVDDTTGALTVTVHSVIGNEVRGTFSGTDKTLHRLDAGSFVCKVPNYVPQADAPNRWRFSAWVNPVFGDYDGFAGNVVSAAKTTKNGRNYLTVTGESDNGASVFKIVVSSIYPIGPGNYDFISPAFSATSMDTLLFQSGVKSWDGIFPRLWSIPTTPTGSLAATVLIESIDNTQVTGTFTGNLTSNIGDVSYGAGGPREIHKARFKATF